MAVHVDGSHAIGQIGLAREHQRFGDQCAVESLLRERARERLHEGVVQGERHAVAVIVDLARDGLGGEFLSRVPAVEGVAVVAGEEGQRRSPRGGRRTVMGAERARATDGTGASGTSVEREALLVLR